MTDPTTLPERGAILKALEAIRDPKSGLGLVSAGLVQALAIGPGRAGFMIEVSAADAALYEPVRAAAEAALKALPHVERAQVVLTAEGGGAPPPAPAHNHGHDHDHGHAHDHAPPPPAPGTFRVSRSGAQAGAPRPASAPPRAAPQAMKPAHVGAVIAVASGKGGVGKSTVAVNLACALAALGYRTGLLDADVYGPSAPLMLGLHDSPEQDVDKRLIPLVAWGVKAVSIGLLVKEGEALIWRGPIATRALAQLLTDVVWGTAAEPLDVLVIDMPPGTGDIQLSLVQSTALAGAVLVSTPQEAALIDVRRGAAMFSRTATPILGVVENMAYFPDPTTGAPIPIFGRGGAKATAEQLGVPFLGEVPIDMALREACDLGRPIVATNPGSVSGQAFLAIAEQVAARLAAGDAGKPAPRIVFED